MKKIIICFMSAFILLGCQKQKTEEITLGKVYTVNDSLQLEILKTELKNMIEPSIKNKNIQITPKEGYQFIDITINITNTSQKQYKISELISGQFQINQKNHLLKMVLETENYTQLTSTDTLKANQERYLHIYCEVPENQKSLDAQLSIKVFNQYQYIYDIEFTEKETKNYQSIGDVLSLKQTQMTIQEVSENKQIAPSQKGFFYRYQSPDNKDETFRYIQLEIYNTSDESLYLDNYIYCEQKLHDQVLKSNIFMESQNHKSFESGNEIKSLEKRIVYLALNVKDEWIKEKGILELFVEGKVYYIEV